MVAVLLENFLIASEGESMSVRLLVTGLALLVAGCVRSDVIPPAAHDVPIVVSNTDAVLVVGMSIRNRDTDPSGIRLGKKCFQDYGIIGFNRSTGLREGNKATRWCESCVPTLLFGDEAAAACKGGINYQAYKLPAGDYALAYLLYDMTASVTTFVKFDHYQFRSFDGGYISRTLSPSAHLLPSTPTITLQPGEVVYAGDVIIDASPNSAAEKWSSASTPDGARRSLAKSGLADRMVVRPWQRFGREIKVVPAKTTRGPDNVSAE